MTSHHDVRLRNMARSLRKGLADDPIFYRRMALAASASREIPMTAKELTHFLLYQKSLDPEWWEKYKHRFYRLREYMDCETTEYSTMSELDAFFRRKANTKGQDLQKLETNTLGSGLQTHGPLSSEELDNLPASPSIALIDSESATNEKLLPSEKSEKKQPSLYSFYCDVKISLADSLCDAVQAPLPADEDDLSESRAEAGKPNAIRNVNKDNPCSSLNYEKLDTTFDLEIAALSHGTHKTSEAHVKRKAVATEPQVADKTLEEICGELSTSGFEEDNDWSSLDSDGVSTALSPHAYKLTIDRNVVFKESSPIRGQRANDEGSEDPLTQDCDFEVQEESSFEEALTVPNLLSSDTLEGDLNNLLGNKKDNLVRGRDDKAEFCATTVPCVIPPENGSAVADDSQRIEQDLNALLGEVTYREAGKTHRCDNLSTVRSSESARATEAPKPLASAMNNSFDVGSVGKLQEEKKMECEDLFDWLDNELSRSPSQVQNKQTSKQTNRVSIVQKTPDPVENELGCQKASIKKQQRPPQSKRTPAMKRSPARLENESSCPKGAGSKKTASRLLNRTPLVGKSSRHSSPKHSPAIGTESPARELHPMPAICTNSYIPNLHESIGGCDWCLQRATPNVKRAYESKGHHFEINRVRGGCSCQCPIFPRANKPIRLCRRCFFDTHHVKDEHAENFYIGSSEICRRAARK